MQCIGAEDILGFLLDSSVLIRGKQFRAYRGIEDIVQDIAHTCKYLLFGDFADDDSDEGFRNIRVDVEVCNVITGESAKAKCLL